MNNIKPSIIGPARRRPSRRYDRPASASRSCMPTPIAVADFYKVDVSEAQFIFDQPVRVVGLPAYRLDSAAGPLATEARSASGTGLEIAFAEPIAGRTIVIPFQDPAVRNATGGFVNAGTHKVPGAAEARDSLPIADPAKKAA